LCLFAPPAFRRSGSAPSIDLALKLTQNDGMFPLLAAMIVFLFLALGSAAFLVCTLIPPIRKYALSTALWFAVWGRDVFCF
jgi:hypothetical protein